MVSALHTNYVLTKFETTRPTNPDILNQVSNPVVWKDRFDWDVYSTFLNLGLYQQDATLIQPYIDWSLKIIKDKPRPAFYNNLILAYQGLDDSSKAEQIRAEAQFLFPKIDFSDVNYQHLLKQSLPHQSPLQELSNMTRPDMGWHFLTKTLDVLDRAFCILKPYEASFDYRYLRTLLPSSLLLSDLSVSSARAPF